MLYLLLQGEKRRMEVNSWGINRIVIVQCSIVVYGGQLGIAVKLYEEHALDQAILGQFWGLDSPRNVIAFWRAILIVQEMDVLIENDLSNAYYAGQRHPHESELSQVEEIIQKIGRASYEAIMKLPIPAEVISLLFEQKVEWNLSGRFIPEEVDAGTLEWSDEFRKLGVKHPDESKAYEAAAQLVIARYEDKLVRYAEDHNHPRECKLLWDIEEVIIATVERCVEENFGKDFVLGASIVLGHAKTGIFAYSMGFGERTDVLLSVCKYIRETAWWLSIVFPTPKIFLSLRTPKFVRRFTYRRTIKQIISRLPNMPIRPLV